MSRFLKSNIDWREIEKRVATDQKANFYAFKGKSDAYLRRVMAFPAEAPKINWDEYKKLVSSSMVDDFKSQYEQLQVPYPADTMSSKIDEQWKQIQEEIQSYTVDQKLLIDDAQKQIARIKALPPFETMTMETYFLLHPENRLDPVVKPTFWPHDEEVAKDSGYY